MMPHPRDKNNSLTKGTRNHQIPKDYHNHSAFLLVNFGKLCKLDSNTCIYTIGGKLVQNLQISVPLL